MKDIFQRIIDDIRDKLEDNYGGVKIGTYGCDLNNELYNTDYIIIGKCEAKEFLGSHVFEAIEMIKDYEQSHCGKVLTDLSDPERVVNMLAYIIGESVLSESDHLQDKWNAELTCYDLAKIAEDLEYISASKIYRIRDVYL